MRPGFNATKRNRNIGTSKRGHGQNNRLCVASPVAVAGPFWEQLGRYQVVKRICGGRDFPIFVEETREDCVHACTVDDVARVLNLLPAQDYARLSAVILEAQPPDRTWWREKSMDPADSAEIERLAVDGHQIRYTRSRIQVQSSLQATRATQLYRTLPHEIGHLVDYTTKVPSADESSGITIDEQIDLSEKYWQRPSQEREAFAHRYADEFRSRMFCSGELPFSRIESWCADGLRSSDFD